MKITRLSIANYKSFSKSANATEDVVAGISDINMIYGYNNSGKSNLLKFIHLLFHPKSTKQEVIVEGSRMSGEEEVAFWKGPITNSPFIFHKNNRSKSIEFSVTIKIEHQEIEDSGFENYDNLVPAFSSTHSYAMLNLDGEIRKIDDYDTAEMVLIAAKLNTKKIYSLDANGRPVYFEGLPAGNVLRGDAIAFSNFMTNFTSATAFLDNNRYLSDEVLDSNAIEFSNSSFKNWLYNLSLDPRRVHILDELNAFIKKYKIAAANTADDVVFKDVEKNSPFANFNPEFARLDNGVIEVMFRRGKDRFPLGSFGTGVHQLLYILAALFTSTARVILIEELELNLSPRYQRELLKILRALITDGRIDQVFFTTHSRYFNYRTDFSIYEINIDATGVSKIVKATATAKNGFFKDVLL